jgi:AraC-like DNA-binding protein
MEWPDIFFSVVIFQLLFLALFLLSKEKGKRISNIFLGLFFLSISLNLIDSFLVLKNAYNANPSMGLWGSCLPLLFGPFLFLYTKSVLYRDFSFSGSKWLHILPFLICFFVTEGSYLALSTEQKHSLLQGLLVREVPKYVYIASALIFLHFFIYAWASFRLIRKFKRQAANKFSDVERQNITWLSTTLVFFVMLMIFGAISGFIRLTPFSQYYYPMLAVLLAGLIIFLIMILLKAMQKPEIFSILEEKETEEMMEVNAEDNGHEKPLPPPKYAYSNLTEADKQHLAERLKLHMTEHKPYLNAELTLVQLSSQMEVRPKVLSQVINESLHQSFFDFVNRYRIEEAKQQLTHPEDEAITILEILYNSGFNSKSSFNTLFKKYTGLTPTEFRKNHEEG